MKVYHHYLLKKRGNGYGQEARQTVGQGEARVDDQTCAGGRFPKLVVCKCPVVGATTESDSEADGFSRKKKELPSFKPKS